MVDMDTERFLVLSGECPGEGVWCWAKTYTELVQCVQAAWGSDFRPVFKYKLPCALTNANTRMHLEVTEVTEQQRQGDTPRGGEAEEGIDAVISAPSKTRPSTCLVVLNDADDFDLWRRGGAYVSAASAPAAPSAKSNDERGAFVHHHGSPADSAQEMMHNVSHHMDHHRAASGVRTTDSRASAAAATLPEEGRTQRAWEPRALTSTLYAFRSGSLALDFLHIQQRRSHGRSASSERAPRRASPPVRCADDVIQAPLLSVLDPALLLRLHVTVVLRHSAAPAEVVLFSSYTPSGQGELPWGTLCLKARHAWGVHSPQFRYVEFTRGVEQGLISNVNDYKFWWRQMRLRNCELLVVEQAPSATAGAALASAEAQAAIRRYYEVEWPVERYSSPKNVVELVRELKALEREERMAAVNRPGGAVKVPSADHLTPASGAEASLRVTSAPSEPLPIDGAFEASGERAAVPSPAAPSGSIVLSPCFPLLLQRSQACPAAIPNPRGSRSSSTSISASSTTTTSSQKSITIAKKIDSEIWSSLLDAEHYARLMRLISMEHPEAAANAGSRGLELLASGEREAIQFAGSAEELLRESPERLVEEESVQGPEMAVSVTQSITALRTGDATPSRQLLSTHPPHQTKHSSGAFAAATDANAAVCTSRTATGAGATAAAATMESASHTRVATVGASCCDEQGRAWQHHALLLRYFCTRSSSMVSARGVGATPIR
ncbi:hypothetical protein LSCM1_05670 [Leishmania martiniquensis]|uniref:Uncharacterized protein n=1 Tax=Leishmania martiniquensis TaxID=1580590 RepID=A0A836KXV4_9TRYP|nr:hypothetical protein LSCM1_05670 [Leishmania martiniquensis]